MSPTKSKEKESSWASCGISPGKKYVKEKVREGDGLNLLHCMIAEETVSCGKIVQRKEIADDVHISRKWEASTTFANKKIQLFRSIHAQLTIQLDGIILKLSPLNGVTTSAFV